MNRYELNNLPTVFFQDQDQLTNVVRFCREIHARMEERHNSKKKLDPNRKYTTEVELPNCPSDVKVVKRGRNEGGRKIYELVLF